MNKKKIKTLVQRCYGTFLVRLFERFIHLLFLAAVIGFACAVFVNVMSPSPSLEGYVVDAVLFSAVLLGWDYFKRWREPIGWRIAEFGIPHTWIGPDWFYVEEIFLRSDRVGQDSAFALRVRAMYMTHRRTGEWAFEPGRLLVQVMIPDTTPESLGLWKGCVIERCDTSGIRRMRIPLMIVDVGPVNVSIE